MRSSLVLFIVSVAFALDSAHAATTSRTSAPIQSLSINGVDCPEVMSWSGGDISGTLVEVVDSNAVTKKQINKVGCEPITIKACPPLSAGLSACLSDLCAGLPTTVTLELLGSDVSPSRAINARLMEARFPAAEAAGKSYYEIIFVFMADSVQPLPGTAPASVRSSPKRALASNFRFTLGTLDTARVSSIEPFTISRALDDAVGANRLASTQTGPTRVSNVVVTLPDGGATAWTAWRDDFLTNGNNADSKELTGVLTLLGPDMKVPLLTLQMSHVGITRLSHDTAVGSTTGHFAATLYCEQITLAPLATTPTPAPVPNPTPATTTTATPKDTTNPNDTGLRDPADFPRPAGLTRTAYSKTDVTYRVSETANYSSEQDVARLLEGYVKAMEADGWKKDSLNESGTSPADTMILTYWSKDKRQADLRLYAAKKGSTVSLSITTAK